MASDSTSFGPLLRLHRLRAGLTQEALAERAGLSTRGLQDLERGVRQSPRLETLRLLADALELDATERAGLIAAARPEVASAPAPGAAARARVVAPPLPPTSLVGREREVAAVCALLRRAEGRLVTISGPGGVGKTRLAQGVAAALAADFSGVAWVELAPLRDPALAPGAVAHALGVPEGGERSATDALIAAIGERDLLLVLDNCEHVLPAMPAIGLLLAACPRLVVLATSRARLRLRGEREFPLGPLALPAVAGADSVPLAGLAGVAAVRLFVERAQAVQPEFAFTEDNASAVAAICRRLDGLPLALELAAAWAKMLPPAALLTRLEERLPLLAGGARDLPPRQRTMGDAIAWSHELLSPAEQRLFRRLAVFDGGFGLDAAEAVAGADGGPALVDDVAALLDHSLLQRIEGPGGEPRFRMLETIREYGLERLAASGEGDPVRDAHAAYCLHLAESAEVGMQGTEQVRWLDRLEADHDNLRAALCWLPARGQVEEALRLAGAVWFFRWIRGYHAESRAQYETLLSLPAASERTVARAKALNGLGVTALSLGDRDLAVASHEEALAIGRMRGDETVEAFSLACLAAAVGDRARHDALASESLALSRKRGDRWGIQMALGLLAFGALQRNDTSRAENLYGESLAIERGLGVRWPTALTLDSLGWLALECGDDRRARALFEEALTLMDEIGDRRDRPDALAGLGRALLRQGDLAGAVSRYEESLVLAREIGEQQGVALALFWLGHARWKQGDLDAAEPLLRQALERYDAMELLANVAACLEALAIVAAARDETERAARLFGASVGLQQRIGAPIPRPDRFETAAEFIPESPLDRAACDAGRALSREQAVAEALAPANAEAR
jgi:predicted ATPase/transcriptional regulator with XRE-family HTH domain